MNTWNDIYDFSEKVLSYILRKKEEEYIQPDQDSPVEKMADKLGNSETLAERLQQQYRYDPIRAYRKLKNYRRRRRIRRYSVAAGILLVLGLGWGWFHQNSPGDPLLLTQTIQPGGKKAVLTLADGSVRQCLYLLHKIISVSIPVVCFYRQGKRGKRKIPKPTICCLFPGEENLQ